MTKCNKSEVNLKSTAYNQNGQNYFEQLTAYNSMNAHIRRILLAKCVVDTRNKTYMRKRKQICKQTDCKPRFVKTEITHNIIDKLAYDTLYHPVDFLRMNYDSKYFCQCEAQKYFASYDYDVICSRSKLHNDVTCPNSPTFKINNSEQFISDSKHVKRHSYTQSSASCRNIFRPVDSKTGVKVKDRYEEKSMYYESASDFLSQDTNHPSSAVSTSRSYGNYKITQLPTNLIDNKKVDTENEEAKYAKFVYEITHEIILNGLYTDEELQEVLKKHIKKNKTLLDMNRMLYEIYQLKLALNMLNNSEDEELEDFAYTQQLLNISTVRPPTPPKVLNENRVTEKLMWYQKQDHVRRNSLDTGNKSVILVDANPELHVTERDVLTSLIEADINPEEARKIYKKLSFKSKDSFSTIGGNMERLNDVYGMEENDKLNHNVTDLGNAKRKANEQDKSCMTDDLITHEHKNVQV